MSIQVIKRESIQRGQNQNLNSFDLRQQSDTSSLFHKTKFSARDSLLGIQRHNRSSHLYFSEVQMQSQRSKRLDSSNNQSFVGHTESSQKNLKNFGGNFPSNSNLRVVLDLKNVSTKNESKQTSQQTQSNRIGEFLSKKVMKNLNLKEIIAYKKQLKSSLAQYEDKKGELPYFSSNVNSKVAKNTERPLIMRSKKFIPRSESVSLQNSGSLKSLSKPIGLDVVQNTKVLQSKRSSLHVHPMQFDANYRGLAQTDRNPYSIDYQNYNSGYLPMISLADSQTQRLFESRQLIMQNLQQPNESRSNPYENLYSANSQEEAIKFTFSNDNIRQLTARLASNALPSPERMPPPNQKSQTRSKNFISQNKLDQFDTKNFRKSEVIAPVDDRTNENKNQFKSDREKAKDITKLIKKNLKFAITKQAEQRDPIGQDQVQKFWLNQFDQGLRNAGLQKRETISEVSSYQSEGSEEWDGEHDAEHYKSQQIGKLNVFLTRQYLDQELERDPVQLPEKLMKGTNPSVKRDILTKKLSNRFDDISSHIIGSFKHEMQLIGKMPKTAVEYRNQLMNELGLKNSSDLARYFVEHTKREHHFKGLKKVRSLSRQNFGDYQKVLYDEDQSGIKKHKNHLRQSQRSSLHDHSDHHKHQCGTEIFMRQITSKIYDKVDRKRTDIMMKERRLELARQKKKALYYEYMAERNQERIKVDTQMRELKIIDEALNNPEIVIDMHQLIEQNLESMMKDSEAYQFIDQGHAKRREMQAIKNNAVSMTYSLKDKAQAQEIKTQHKLKNFQKNVKRSVTAQISGSKVDFLVEKFVRNLKQKVQDRKDQVMIQSNEQFIRSIIKKNEYNSSYKNAKPKPQAKKEKRGLILDSKRFLEEQGVKREQELQTIEEDQQADESEIAANMEQNNNEVFASKSNPIHIHASSSDSDDSIEEQGVSKYQDQSVKKKILQKYINQSIENKEQPLPVLQRIQMDGSLSLLNYQMNASNSQSLAKIMRKIIPKLLKKLYCVNNAMSDEQVAEVVGGLAQSKQGLKTLGLMQNQMGAKTFEMVAYYVRQRKAFGSLKKFVLKDTQATKDCQPQLLKLSKGLLESAQSSLNLNKLTLSRIGLSGKCLQPIAEAILQFQSLEHLNLSGNCFNKDYLTHFIVAIDQKNRLRSLNISYNPLTEAQGRGTIKRSKDEETPIFEEAISDFIHYSSFLLHIDLSGSNLLFEQCLFIAESGFSKSRTLLAAHMSGLGLLDDQIVKLRRVLKINQTYSQREIKDDVLDSRFKFATIDSRQWRNVVNALGVETTQQIFEKGVNSAESQANSRAKKALKDPILLPDEGDRIVYERVLGHSEQPDSHRWVENYEADSIFYSKKTYTVFFWNKRLVGEDNNSQFYKYLDLDIVNFHPNYKSPILCTKGKVFKMIPLAEFLQRLKQSSLHSTSIRACNNEIELKHYQDLSDSIKQSFDQSGQVLPTYWSAQKTLRQKGLNEPLKQFISNLTQKLDPVKKTIGLQSWSQNLQSLLPKNAYLPISVNELAFSLNQIYDSSEEGQQLLQDETFICSIFLPAVTQCQHFTISDPEMEGCFASKHRIPKRNHLSINTVPIIQRRIKKVKEIRHFVKQNSVFAKFAEDDQKIVYGCWEKDKELMKVKKFVKDQDEQARVYQVFLKYYHELKGQFLSLIGKSKSYPSIDWLDFVGTCSSWKITDKNLTSGDIDRIFIATNFEEEDLEENDDSSLCRYEYFEIIARMAKTKYLEKNLMPSLSEALDKLISDFIIPNTIEKMENQKFRDEQLWTLEVNDLFEANMVGIQALWKAYSIKQKGKVVLSPGGAINMLDTASIQDLQGINCQILAKRSEDVVQAYSLSKMTIVDEMEGYEKYSQMQLVEFYEFIGRLSHFIFENTPSLTAKIQNLLEILLPLVKCEFKPFDADKDIDSESDYDDDLVDDIIQNKFKQ